MFSERKKSREFLFGMTKLDVTSSFDDGVGETHRGKSRVAESRESDIFSEVQEGTHWLEASANHGAGLL